MILNFQPQNSLSAQVSDAVDVVDENTIVINGTAYRADPSLSVIDPAGPVLGGTRDPGTGILTLSVFYNYCTNDYLIWETAPYKGSTPESFTPSGDALPGTAIQLTGQTEAQILASLIPVLVAQVNACLMPLLSQGFSLTLPSGGGPVTFGFSDDLQIDATGLLTEIVAGAPPTWPYPWPDINSATVYFQSAADFMAYVGAVRTLKYNVSQALGAANAAIRAAATVAQAQAAFATFQAANPIPGGGS